VPDKCSFVVDVRSNERYSNDELLAIIKKNVACEVTARSTRLSSSATPLEHPVVKRAIELNRTIYGSPTLSDQALMPFASVKMGPGKSERSHTADEFILTTEIDEAIDLYIKLLDGIRL
jgi:acetylornithine deacetylase